MAIDIAFGTAKLEYDDVIVPGKVPLTWGRRYSTAFLDRPPTALGRGWTCPYFATLEFVEGRFVFVTPEGGTEVFPDPGGAVANGRVIRNLSAFLEIFRQGDRCIVQSWNVETGDVRRCCFVPNNSGLPWQLSSLEDVTGHGLDLTWDLSGRLQSVRQRLERRELRVAYDKSGMIEGVALHANGERHSVMTYAYDDAGQQVEARDAARFADRFEYDDRGRIKREIVRDGGVFRYKYDEKGRCVLRTGLGHYNEKRLRYLDAIRVTEVTDSYDRTFSYHHLLSGQTVLEVDPLGGRQSTEYDQYGRIVAKTDATGAVTRFLFDEHGNRAAVVDALGNTTSFTFNVQHQALTMTDAAGHQWTRVYDVSNRLSSTIDPLGSRWSFRYDVDGNLTEIINPKGDSKRQVYSSGTLQAVVDWRGSATQFVVDALGRATQRTGPLGETTRYRYDAVGNCVEVLLPDGARLEAAYDQAKNLVRLVDESGHVATWRYGPCVRLLESRDASGGNVRYVWGSERGRLDQIVNEKGETYTFFRDGAGRIVREISFDGAERQFRYDAEGYLVAHTNANGETVSIERDPLHRVVSQALPDGEKLSFAFDALGNLTTAVSSDVAVRFERDGLGRVIRESQGDHFVESGYDAVGNRTHIATSLGHAIDYQYDANGLVNGLATSSGDNIRFERNAYGQETAREMPGARLQQRYDNGGRLIEQRVLAGRGTSRPGLVSSSTDLVRRTYSHKPNGSVARVEDSRLGWVDYSYGPCDRLLAALRERGSSERYEYDVLGNVTRARVEGARVADDSLVYGPGGRLLRRGDSTYEYDAEGRRIRETRRHDGEARTWTYQWNALDRLKSIDLPNGQRLRFRYDALARRVAKELTSEKGGTTQQFLWDQEVVAQELSNGSASNAWIFDQRSFAPLATVQGGKLHSIVNDQIGTPQEILDPSGNIVWTCERNCWGASRSPEVRNARVLCPIGFQGQWKDDETELSYSVYRYYDPSAMRYLSRDPIGLPGGLNPYRYVTDPINWIDPMGLELQKGDPLPPGTVVHRIGGGTPENLQLKPGERKIDPPGISTLAGGTPQQAADAMRAAFPKGTDLQAASQTTGTASVDAIRAAGFDVIHDPSKKFPNHARLVHPEGVAGFDDPENRKKLSGAFEDSKTCSGAG